MQFTVVSVFNHQSLGLAGPSYAVILDAPETLGGGRRVVDVVPADDRLKGADILKGFREAARSLPFRRTTGGGGEIDFLGKDMQGHVHRQSRAHIPAKPLAGKGFVESYYDWLCWRARVNLWLQGTARVDLSAPLAARLLETLPPREAPDAPVREKLRLCEAPADGSATPKEDRKTARVRGGYLTQKTAPL